VPKASAKKSFSRSAALKYANSPTMPNWSRSILGGTLEIRPSGDIIIPFLTAVDDELPEVVVLAAFVLLLGVFEEFVEFLLVAEIVDAETELLLPFENCPWLF
jgi:hypothetical protein